MNEHWLTSLPHARVVVEAWHKEYNEERPKRSLGGLTPAAYAKTLIQKPVKLTLDSKAQCYRKRGDVGAYTSFIQTLASGGWTQGIGQGRFA